MPFIVRPGKNRKYNHIPIYWDQEKEELEERVKKINDDLDMEEKGEYTPNFRGQFGRPRSRYSLWQGSKPVKSYRGKSFFFVINVILVIVIIYLAFKLIPILAG